MEDNIKQAYKKLKSYLYHDKTLLCEKIKLSEFEENLDENIKTLADKIENKNLDEFINNISYRLVPKKIRTEEESKNKYTNQTEKESYDIEAYNVFIDAPIEIHIISTLWTMLVGEKLDIELSDSVYSNRLHRDEFKLFNIESSKFFKPYYQGYSNFRDNAINMALSLHKQKLDATVLNIDIKEFFYNISFNFNSITNVKDEHGLNNLMQKIHDKYHEEVKNLKPNINTKQYDNKEFLPIGLVSSYVISNFILKEFDEYIEKDLKPEYYGRYVDDMLFVFSNTNKKLDSKDIVCELLNKKGTIKLSCKNKEESDIELNVEKRKFILQEEKVKIFHFYKNDSISLLEKFKSTIDENSSFFNFLPDDERLFDTLESSSFNIFYSDSENKIGSLVGISKDTLNISRNLASIMTVTAYADFDKSLIELYNKQIKNVFKGKHIFELRLYWERVFSYIYINKKYKLFIYLAKYFKEIIEKMENNEGKKLKKDCIEFLEQSIIFAVATNPKYFKDKIIKDLKEIGLVFDEHENPFKSTISSIRNANMFNQNLVVYPILNYAEIDDEFDLTSKKVELSNFDISERKREFSPRFIHYHEVALFQHRINMIKNKGNY
jgi:hypothetical protein